MGILKNRVAIITGASSGVGKGCAEYFAEQGAIIVACARRLEKLEELSNEVSRKGGKMLPVRCDVGIEDDIAHVVETTIKEFGKVDILANIAQGDLDKPNYLVDTTYELALDSFKTGAAASMLFMQKCFPYMKEANYGRIINCASASALIGTPGFAAYEMAKGGVMALTRNAAKEWAQYGIVTNCFLPMILTESFEKSEQGKAAAKKITEQIPTRYFGKPYEDCGPIVAFMASEEARYLNGQMIGVDGGFHLLA